MVITIVMEYASPQVQVYEIMKKIANCLQFAIKQNIMKKKKKNRRRYLWREQQMYLHVLSLK